jgi:hypothetical protein
MHVAMRTSILQPFKDVMKYVVMTTTCIYNPYDLKVAVYVHMTYDLKIAFYVHMTYYILNMFH